LHFRNGIVHFCGPWMGPGRARARKCPKMSQNVPAKKFCQPNEGKKRSAWSMIESLEMQKSHPQLDFPSRKRQRRKFGSPVHASRSPRARSLAPPRASSSTAKRTTHQPMNQTSNPTTQRTFSSMCVKASLPQHNSEPINGLQRMTAITVGPKSAVLIYRVTGHWVPMRRTRLSPSVSIPTIRSLIAVA
jgi:hypothetical protein